ncbi:hypothetical protein FRC11_014413, partial [Ceratobasidium sp. 423]
LWTEIVVSGSDNEPYHFTALCLARSGATAPLDINIELWSRKKPHSDRWNPPPENLIQRACNVYEFLDAHGAPTPRWRSFELGTNIFEILIRTIKIIQSSPTPYLQSIDILFDETLTEPGEIHNELHNSPSERLFLDLQPSQLHTAKFIGVPFSYIFGNPSDSQLAGLTYLELESLGTHPDLGQLSHILRANPRLSNLSLSVSPVSGPDSALSAQSGQILKVHLPYLRKLCLPYSPSALWAKSILAGIDAPSLKTLKLCQDKEPGELLGSLIDQADG